MRHNHLLPSALLIGGLALGCAGAATDTDHAIDMQATPTDQPIELGKVHWGRDYTAAQARAARTDRDLLMLFQEVPG